MTQDNNKLVKWFNTHKKRKAQRKQLKEELMPIAWHPTRMQDWFMTKNDKKRIKEMLT